MQPNLKKSTIYQVFYTHIKTYSAVCQLYLNKMKKKMGIFIVKTKNLR